MQLDPRQRLVEATFYQAAQEYLRSLPLEHFMEATAQATQRKITLASLELVQVQRPEVQVFNELLVQYRRPREKRIRQVVPDNMVVVWETPIKADGNYDLPVQPVGPFWVLEYVSKSSKRKDYEDNMVKYERDVKVPYYLMFHPEIQEISLFRLNSRRRYASVLTNDAGRYSIPELELEVGILDEWMRFWFKDELLPLPGELLTELTAERLRRKEAEDRAEAEKQRADSESQRADAEKQRADALEARIRELERARKNGSH